MLSNRPPPMVGARRIGMGKNGNQDTPSTGSMTGDRRSSIACDRATDICGNAEAAVTVDSVHVPIGPRLGAATSRVRRSRSMWHAMKQCSLIPPCRKPSAQHF
jgi:hypothetical protein